LGWGERYGIFGPLWEGVVRDEGKVFQPLPLYPLPLFFLQLQSSQLVLYPLPFLLLMYLERDSITMWALESLLLLQIPYLNTALYTGSRSMLKGFIQRTGSAAYLFNLLSYQGLGLRPSVQRTGSAAYLFNLLSYQSKRVTPGLSPFLPPPKESDDTSSSHSPPNNSHNL
jgi:hypothetical protein